jgi:hypothetical protein
MDRTRARGNIRAGLLAGGLALLMFGLAFYVSVLYIG